MKNGLKSSLRKTVLLFLTTICTVQVHALSLVDLDSTISKIFSFTQDNNAGSTSYRSLLIPGGGKAETMGCAFTGLCNDINFIEYNPAASSILNYTEGSIAHNKWIADSSLETIQASTRFGNLGLGAQLKCFYVPFAEYNMFGEKTNSSYYSETTAVLNVSYNFLCGYTFKGIALGMNLKSSIRNVPNYTDSITNAIISGSGFAQSGIALMGDVGLLFRMNAAKYYASREPNLGIGFSILNAGAGVTGFGEKLQLDDPLPTRICAGVSYRILKPLVITADLVQPVNLFDFFQSETASFSAGIDFNVTDFFSVAGGLQIKGSNPKISIGSEFLLKNFMVNGTYTLDLTSSANPVNRISISAKMLFGDKGRADIQKKVDEYYTKGLEYYAQSGMETKYEDTRKYLDLALEAWNNALSLDKTFDPAATGIQVILQEKENLRKVQEAQSLDQ